jgi:hypothetical protein
MGLLEVLTAFNEADFLVFEGFLEVVLVFAST